MEVQRRRLRVLMTKSTGPRKCFVADVNQACESAFRQQNIVGGRLALSYNARFVVRVNDPSGCLFP
jgi:hypothetical protein